MPSKLNTIRELSRHTLKSLSGNMENWTGFLHSATKHYKYPFYDQLLIHAQRPDAVACATFELWNNVVKRSINRGAKGIALIDDSHNRPILRYVFDVSDTNTRRNIPFQLWQMRKSDQTAVIEELANHFGEDSAYAELPFQFRLFSIVNNAIADNITDYIAMLYSEREGSSLEELDESGIEAVLTQVLEYSVGFICMTRAGIDAGAYFSDLGVQYPISAFDTPRTISCLGQAASDISEMVLRQIERTVRDNQRSESEKFAQSEIITENEEKDVERGAEHEQPHIYTDGRLSDTQPDVEPTAGNRDRQIWADAQKLLEGAENGDMQPYAVDGGIVSSLAGSGQDGTRTGEADHRTDGASRGRDGGIESQRPDGMGAEDEQYQAPRGGTGNSGVGIQLGIIPSQAEQIERIQQAEAIQASAFPISQQIIDGVLSSGGNEENSTHRIASYFKKDHTPTENAEFLKKEYGNGGKGFVFDGNHVSVWFNDSGIHIAAGDTALNAADAALVTWEQASRRVRELLDMGRYMPQSELDKVDGYEIMEIAEQLWHLRRGIANGVNLPLGAESFKNGLPNDTEQIAEILTEPAQRQEILNGIKELTIACSQDPSILRFPRSTQLLVSTLNGLSDLNRDPISFTADETVSTARPGFITQDEIDRVLIGSGAPMNTQKLDIYAYFLQNHTAKEKAGYLKHKYGTGGSGRLGFSQGYDSKGITYSRSINHMQYDKVILPWPKVARRIDELMADGKYMNQQELDYIPEYEKVELARAVVGFYPYQPEDLARPYPRGAEYTDCVKIVRPQLDEPERVADIIKNMAEILDNTAEVDRNYKEMQKAFGNLTAYHNGTYSLFTPAVSSEKTIPAIQLPEPPTVAIDEAVEYNLQLGATVFIGADENEICSLNETSVVLRDINAPLFIRTMSREEFDRKLRENRLNDHLIIDDSSETSPIEEEVSVESDKSSMVIDLRPLQEREPSEPQPAATEKVEKPANFRISDDALGHGGQKTKYGYNIAAIYTLQQIETERRYATPEEQEVLSRYVGWGGIPQTFDESKPNWANEYAELKELLSDKEYADARATTLNAHYTSPVVIKSIYEAIERMGFQAGNILEPSMGIGNFFGLLPESMQGSRLYGVEIDSITGRIAEQLYPNARIAVQGYEDTNLPDSFFDVAVGNVPFGSYGIMDKRYEKNKFLIHDYFFAKTLDKVRPGGVIAFITSKGTLDKKNPEVRKYIAQRAELLGAVRLPNNAFLANAGTEVTADILFLQKREALIQTEPDWVHPGLTPEGVPINAWYIDHPGMVLGKMVFDDSMYGNAKETACIPIKGADLAEQLREALSHIHGKIPAYTHEQELDGDGLDTIPVDPDVRNFSYTVIDEKIYYREDSIMRPVSTSITGANRIKGMVELRDCMRNLIDMQLEDYPNTAIAQEQQRLNTLYDAYTEKYGIINSRGNEMAFSEDSGYFLLCSLEVLDDEQNFKRKADMFTKRTINPHVPVTSVETPSEALAVSISECGKVDMGYMMELSGLTEDAIAEQLQGVLFKDLSDGGGFVYSMSDEFLTGNVREKLHRYEHLLSIAPDGYEHLQTIQTNVEALKRVQPKDLTASEIDVRLGASWIPPDVVKKFIDELFEPGWFARERVQVQYSSISGNWNISNKSCDHGNEKVNRTYGTKRINGYKMVENTLNLRDVRIYDTVYEDGKEKRVLNAKETVIAQQKQQAIKEAFQDWIWKDTKRREQLTKLYNETYNCIRQREYGGSHIRFVGMNPEINLRPHQVNAVARALYGGNTLLAHVVGSGKTFTMSAIAMESKRLGLSHKSMIVVPNHIVGQFAGEFLQLYPSANILVANKKDFEPGNRKKFCARIATGEYDAVIIGHSQFEKVPMSMERQREYLEKEIEELMEGIREAKRERAESFTVKQMEATRKSLEVKLKKLNSTSRKDNVIDFEALGVDRLFVDEADNYKNLFLQTKMHNVAGIPQTEAQKSSDMFMKSQYINEITNYRGMVFATGTPISNSMTELYTMQRYLQFNTLRRYNLEHFDSWASTFGERVTAIEIAPEGTGYRAKTRFSKFFNLPELLGMFRLVADIQTKDMLGLPTPKVEHHNVALKSSELQREMVAALAERAEMVRKGGVLPTEDNMLRITNDGRKLALDQRLMNDMLPDNPESKTNACVENVYDIWERTAKDKLTQLVFSDLSTPKGDGSYNVYEDMRDKLIAKGIPFEEIAFIHDANTDERKMKLFAQVRSGQVRVLLGSTTKMGAGTNVQTLLVAEHHLDCPWRPRDIEQREGRIERQGNTNEVVHIYRYVTEGTFDSYMWQTLEGKQRFISQIMTSKTPARSCEDVDENVLSFAEVKALAAGDPDIKERMQLDTDIKRLQVLKSNYLSNKYELEDAVNKTYPAQIERLTRTNEAISKDIVLYDQHKSDEFPGMELCGMQFKDKAKAGAALIETCKAQTDPKPHPIGQYCGFSVLAEFDAFAKCFYMALSGSGRYRVELGTDAHGNIQRLDNQLKSFPDKMAENSAKIKELERQQENAKADVEKPFSPESELKQKQARLAELDAKLKINDKGSDAAMLDATPEETRQEHRCDGLAR